MAEEQEGLDQMGGAEGEEPPPYWVEVWNDYDPSQRFVSIFPVGEKGNVLRRADAQDPELVSAQAGERLARPHLAAEACGSPTGLHAGSG